MIITNYGSYLGKPRLTLTRSGNTLTVKTFGRIPSNSVLFMCYSTLGYEHQSRQISRRPHPTKDFKVRHRKAKKYKGRKRFTSRGTYISGISSNSTYTFSLSTPRKWSHLRSEARTHYEVRAELRRSSYCFGARTRYVSNILSIEINP